MDAPLIRKKEILTHERIMHDLKTKSPNIGSWLLSWLVLIILFVLLVLNRHNSLAVVIMIPCTLCGLGVHLYVSRILYHDICVKKGHYRIESAELMRVHKGRSSQNYAMYFSNNKHFTVHENHRYYTWSPDLSLSSYGVAKVYAECGDTFYLVMHGKQIVMVYNTKLFELET